MLRILVAFVLVCSLGAGAVPAAPAAPAETPEIVEVYPNPAADGDAGEFVTVEFPPGTNVSAYALADTHASAALARAGNLTDVDERRRITFSTEVDNTEALTERTVRPLSDRVRLANDGDRVRLLRDGTVVDEVAYDRAGELSVYNVTRDEWHPLGMTRRSVAETTGGTVEAFVLPDEPDRAVELLESAEERIYLAGYTLSSRRVVAALTEAREAGVSVDVLVDGAPVGGMSEAGASALEELAESDVDVRAIEGEYARYRFHHAKYAVVDDRALVTSENWKPSGIGGRSSRGWAVVTDQRPIVDGLAATFRADAGWVDAVPWEEYDRPSPVESEPADGSYPAAFEAETFAVERTELLLAPDNAEPRLREAIRNAEESIDIKQVRIGDEGFPLLREAVRAAERGVDVRILLAGAWYVEEENEQLERWLEEQASADDLPLEVRVGSPGGAFEKIHAKGLIVDGEVTLVGSVNWNRNSLRRNREVGLLIESEGIAAYFRRVFESDWERTGTGRDRQFGLALAALFVAVLAILAASRLRFEPR